MLRFRLDKARWPSGRGKAFISGNIAPTRTAAALSCISWANNFFDLVLTCSHCWWMAVRNFIFLGMLVCASSVSLAAEDAVSFGFSGPETFPIDQQIS